MEFFLRLLCPCSLLIVVMSADNDHEKFVSPRYPIGDPRNCFINGQEKLHRLEAVPGSGWDNLQNMDMGTVKVFNFSQCKTTADGRYLIPDHVFTVPVKHSNVEVFAEIFDHWQNYTSVTSLSINAEASLFSFIHGSFSSDHQSVKKTQINSRSKTTRVQIRHLLYSARLESDAPLHPAFKTRILDIGAQLQNNNTKQARYLAQLLVRDYGTHYVTHVDAGAALVQEEFVKSSFINDYTSKKSEIKASAGASFFSYLKASGGISKSTSQEFIDQYISNRTYSHIETFGGPAYQLNFSVHDWESNLNNELVAIDRSGDPLHYVISSNTVKELPDPTVRDVSEIVRKAIKQYYKFNTYLGCTNMDSKNFNFQANIDDGSCETPLTNFTFGGVYQTCSSSSTAAGDLCSELEQKNPLTGKFSCPENYQAILLNSGRKSYSFSRYECHRSCHRCWLVAKCCKDDCGNQYYASSATYMSYWCVATGAVSQESGFLFGGLYTTSRANPLTGAQTCPAKFYALRLGAEMKVCVSDDYELGYRFSAPFAGFHSCTAGNPLALGPKSSGGNQTSGSVHKVTAYVRGEGPGAWPRRCPKGYSQHLATVDDDCEIDYCLKANALSSKGLPPVIRPPFHKKPGVNPNSTYTTLIVGPSGKIWWRNEDTNMWERITADEAAKLHLTPNTTTAAATISQNESGPFSTGATAGLSVGLTVVAGLLILAAFVGCRRKRAKSRFGTSRTMLIDEGSNDRRYEAMMENQP